MGEYKIANEIKVGEVIRYGPSRVTVREVSRVRIPREQVSLLGVDEEGRTVRLRGLRALKPMLMA